MADKLKSLPIVVLNPEHRCNCRCAMCGYWKDSHPESLEFEIIENEITQWPAMGVRWVGIGGGEPLLYPRFSELCRKIRDTGVRLSLMTNGIELADKACEVARYFTDIFLSLDGPPEIHDSIRNVPGAFDRLAQGVEAVRKENTQCEIIARCTIQRRNHADLARTVETALDLGLDRISFIPLDSRKTTFKRKTEKLSESGFPGKEELSRLKQQIEVLGRQFGFGLSEGIIAESEQWFRDRVLGYFQTCSQGEKPASPRCNAPWVSVLIEADGSVRPCFFQPPMGNIRNRPLCEIINSSKATEFRRNLDVKDNSVCRGCVCGLYHEVSKRGGI